MVSSKNNKHQQVYIPCHTENIKDAVQTYHAEKRNDKQGESIGEVAPMTTNKETATSTGEGSEGEAAPDGVTEESKGRRSLDERKEEAPHEGMLGHEEEDKDAESKQPPEGEKNEGGEGPQREQVVE
eukprot:GHVU01021528.1.p3 GENE.GHVU01021528.1~~GHVU01021528.1.p3  ORF type:complete len:127 (+),score=37.82 GHVU01021528.1:19-399(+)